MNNCKKMLNDFANLFQKSVLITKDIKKEISNILKFKRENILQRLNVSSQDQVNELELKINKLNLEIKKLKNLTRKR
jgi:polyhydroxyalkanoate synthesis regulator phasin